jgi:hypothetical protein
VKKWMKTAIAFSGLVMGTAAAQTGDGSNVILPLEAQTCNLPAAPATIPEDASYDQLVEAKGNVVSFQDAMVSYRDCLDTAGKADNLTEGNQVALNNAHNYSVEMEERVAEQFNVAVRAYKARQAEQQEK